MLSGRERSEELDQHQHQHHLSLLLGLTLAHLVSQHATRARQHPQLLSQQGVVPVSPRPGSASPCSSSQIRVLHETQRTIQRASHGSALLTSICTTFPIHTHTHTPTHTRPLTHRLAHQHASQSTSPAGANAEQPSGRAGKKGAQLRPCMCSNRFYSSSGGPSRGEATDLHELILGLGRHACGKSVKHSRYVSTNYYHRAVSGLRSGP